MSSFTNTVKTEWLEGNPRDMRLIEEVIFIDKTEFHWIAPANSIIDGASIPAILWSIIGSPFVGLYRRASVIHDVYCVNKILPHELVHQMFFDAMIEDGVDEAQAQAMYIAVSQFGPKWDIEGNDLEVEEPPEDYEIGW